MTATSEVIRARERHHKALEALAKSINPANSTKGIVLWRNLAKLERKAHKAMEDYCNGTATEGAVDRVCETVKVGIWKIFGGLPPRFHVNHDPRGYALKLLSNESGTEAATPFALEQDWGRNQILAPTIE